MHVHGRHGLAMSNLYMTTANDIFHVPCEAKEISPQKERVMIIEEKAFTWGFVQALSIHLGLEELA